MPSDKDFKRLVRARMTRTGEAYTAARAQLLGKRQPRRTPDYTALAGIADATIAARTGRGWKDWVSTLDAVGAHAWPHRDIARYVHDTFGVPDWWTQTVTVGYERIKGLRAIGQRRDGGYEVNKSRVFPVPVSRLYRAFHDARTRRRWLGAVELTIRSAAADKSVRLTWPDGTTVDLYFAAKHAAKSQLAVQHRKLADKASADRLKAWWTERLTALEATLAPLRRR
jgi:hypothetical protein